MPGTGRGRWTRGLSSEERRAEQLARVLRATGDAVRGSPRGAIVQNVIDRAGVGRNTFYELFEDVDGAIDLVRRAAQRAIASACDRAVRDARTPREKFRALSAAWVEEAARQGSLAGALFALEDGPKGPRDALRADLRERLRRVISDAMAAGTIGLGPEAARVELVLGAFEAAGRLASSPDGGPGTSLLAEALADLVVRTFR